MVKPINKNIFFLQQKAEPATKADAQVMRDLLDTMQAHQMECAGMAANMIGVNKRIIVVNLGMVNLQGSRNLLHTLFLRTTTHTGNGNSDIHRRTEALVEQVGLKENLAVRD